MEADYEHYKLHWEFFKSVNPKASELFFIDLQLKKLNETLENGLVNIDFSNDNTQTLEGYLNDLKRKGFFFDKEYKEFLDAKLKELKNKEYLRELPPQTAEPKQEQQPPTFKNNFDKVKSTDIYNHFKAGLVDKDYLTEQELNKYLKAAFELKTIPETLFKLKDAPSKEKIYLVFYTYYINVAGKPHAKQTQYVELLGNYFEGYNSNTIRTNWAKGYIQKKH